MRLMRYGGQLLSTLVGDRPVPPQWVCLTCFALSAWQLGGTIFSVSKRGKEPPDVTFGWHSVIFVKLLNLLSASTPSLGNGINNVNLLPVSQK